MLAGHLPYVWDMKGPTTDKIADDVKQFLAGKGVVASAATVPALFVRQNTDGADRVVVRVGALEVPAILGFGDTVEQDMGLVLVGEPEEVAGIRLVTVNVGNPHAVVEGDPADLPRIGPLLETHERFPNRTNVQVARRVGSTPLVWARVWERGAGETASSGSSAVAVAAALGVSPATIRFPGGDLQVRLENGRAFLTGPARRIN